MAFTMRQILRDRVSTRVLTPFSVMWAAFFNFVAPLDLRLRCQDDGQRDDPVECRHEYVVLAGLLGQLSGI
jgi:hypothetical protein